MNQIAPTNFYDVLNTVAKKVWVLIPIAVLMTGVKCREIIMDSSVNKSEHRNR